jgi:hypothetical protein
LAEEAIASGDKEGSHTLVKEFLVPVDDKYISRQYLNSLSSARKTVGIFIPTVMNICP